MKKMTVERRQNRYVAEINYFLGYFLGIFATFIFLRSFKLYFYVFIPIVFVMYALSNFKFFAKRDKSMEKYLISDSGDIGKENPEVR